MSQKKLVEIDRKFGKILGTLDILRDEFTELKILFVELAKENSRLSGKPSEKRITRERSTVKGG